jgi:hypothetical protein
MQIAGVVIRGFIKLDEIVDFRIRQREIGIRRGRLEA